MWFQIIAACLVLVCVEANSGAVSHQARSDNIHPVHHVPHHIPHHDHHHGHHLSHHDHHMVLGHGHGHHDDHHHHVPSYKFSYSVHDPKTGDNKEQAEWRHGDVVKGEYALVEPDGNLRSVHYSADHHSGFHADVHHKTHHHHIHSHHHGHNLDHHGIH